jgi:peptidoglycan hydrolase-like protein with peptidoglycan-binding domain
MRFTSRLVVLSTAALLSAAPLMPAVPATAADPDGAAIHAVQKDGCRRTLPRYPILKPGARRPAVRTLQCSLNDVGVGPVAVDGFYGKQTRAAVSRIEDGFEGDGPPHPGRINNGFWTILFGAQLPDRRLELGDHGRAVKVLQRALRAAGGDLVVDGDFGTQTKGVVQAYQREHGLSTTGRVGADTRFILAMGGVFGELS